MLMYSVYTALFTRIVLMLALAGHPAGVPKRSRRWGRPICLALHPLIAL